MTSTTIPSVSAEPAEPVRRAVMVQRWADLVYLHWRYDPAVVQALLPDGLEVDVADGSAWVGLIPFRMEGLGLPHLAPLPLVGTFPEVNVRTYVVRNGRRGVWFFSLDVDRILPVAAARAGFHLPYCLARASHARAGDVITTSVHRRWPRPPHDTGDTAIAVRDLGPDTADDPLDRFLTARWGLFATTRSGRLRYAPVDHPAWPLRHAEVLHLDDRLVAAAGLPSPEGEPRVRWSPGVDVRIGRPTRV
ncbi:MAG: DUF2071 domain-containing protein [Actinomycetota bacterium]